MDKKTQDKVGLVLIVVMVVVMIVGFSIRAMLTTSGDDPRRDRTTLCLKRKAPAERVVILVDKSDPLTREQVRMLRDAVFSLKNGGLEQDGMLSIFAIGDFANGPIDPVFCLCNPGFKANLLYQNPERLKATFEQRFGAPLDAALGSLAAGDSAGESPLLEALQALSGTAEFAGGVPRRLIMVSDLLQHTPKFTAYTRTHSFKRFRTMPAYNEVKCDLSGASVQIWWTRHKRDQAYSGNDLMQFWTEYLRDCGATVEPYRMF